MNTQPDATGGGRQPEERQPEERQPDEHVPGVPQGSESAALDMTPIILDHLKQAAEAHGVHEATELAGVYDEQWPEWYAAHMNQTLRDAGYRLVRSL